MLKYETNEKVNKHNKGKIILFSILGVILVALVAAISIHLSNVYSNGRNEDETFNNNYSSNVNNPNKQESINSNSTIQKPIQTLD